MNIPPIPVEWERKARNGLRVTLRTSAWLFSAAGGLLEIASKTLNQLSERYPPEPPRSDGK